MNDTYQPASETFNVNPEDVITDWNRDDLARAIYANCAAFAAPNVVRLDKPEALKYLGAFVSFAHLAAAVFFDEATHADKTEEKS